MSRKRERINYSFSPIFFLSFDSSPIRNLKEQFARQEIGKKLSEILAFDIKHDRKHQGNLRSKVFSGT